MYLILLPLWDIYGQLDLNYAERLDMIKKSLLFKSCINNTIFSYLLLLLEIISFSLFVTTYYALSVNFIPLESMYGLNILLLVFYVVLSFGLYSRIDQEDYRIRIRSERIYA